MPVTRIYPSRTSLRVRTSITNGGAPTLGNVGTVIDTTGSVTHGDNVPDWRKKIARGQNATTTLVGAKKLVKGLGSGTYTFQSKTNPGNVHGEAVGDLLYASSAFINFATSSTVISTVADDKARSKLLSSYISARNTWRGGNFLAEFGETVEMIRHPLKAFYHRTWDFAGFVRRLGKIHARNPIEYSRAIASAYLAFIFGVKPLIDDITDATKAVNEQLGFHRFDRRPIHGTGRDETVTDNSQGFTAPPGFPAPNPSFRHYYKTKQLSSVRYKGAIKAAPTAMGQQFDIVGLGVYDILPAVWEAIPWSFFIDYFANVGEMIDACRLASADVVYMNRTFRNSGTKLFQPLFYIGDNGGGYNVSLSAGQAWTLSLHVDRRSSNLPNPHWNFRIPGIGSMKWLNIDALALQIFGSKNKKIVPQVF
jgi:hypothetical protein